MQGPAFLGPTAEQWHDFCVLENAADNQDNVVLVVTSHPQEKMELAKPYNQHQRNIMVV